MNLLRLTLVLLLIADVLAAQPVVPSNLDHLIPVDLTKNENYRKALVSKIAITPFNCGRALLLPPFEPEASSSVYWISKNGRRTYYVTCISAKENLWQRTDAGHYPIRARSVKIDRLDAEIPKQTAQLINEVWLRMLQGPYGPHPIIPPANVTLVDTTDAEFSLERSNEAPLYGRLNFSLSFPGKKTKQLVDVWNILYEYCKAPVEKRPKIAERIEQQARQFLAQLK